MATTEYGQISPELVLVCPELRASLVKEYLEHERDALVSQLASFSAASVVRDVDEAVLNPAVDLGPGHETGIRRRPPLLVAAAAYAAQQSLVLALNAAAVAIALGLVLLAIVQLHL
jgi:hypothetical protein